MLKNLLRKIDDNKNKRVILIAVIALLVVGFGVSYCSKPPKNAAQEDMALNVLAIGYLPDLNKAMRENAPLRRKVEEVLSFDEAYLFVNYRQVNALMMDILFLWGEITPAQIKSTNKKVLAEKFIRHVYGLDEDDLIRDNPLLEDKPWSGLFNKMKAKILMQGAGHKIFDGVAYYDSNRDRMVIEGGLSEGYLRGLNDLINTQSKDTQKGYRNNYLLFIDNTLGFENLNDTEKKLLKELGFF